MISEKPNLDPKNLEDIEKRKKVLIRPIESRLRSYVKEVREENGNLSKEEILREGFVRLLKRFREVIPQKDGDISILADYMARLSMDDKEKFIEDASSNIADFLLSNFTLEEIEQIARRHATYENYNLNRLVEYGISDNIIHIHSPLTFIDNPMELRILFLDALNKLAEKLKNDPKLAKIEKITASSWIVVKAQRAFKEAGFTITKIDKDKDLGEAEITREKLIEIYAK